MTNITTPAPYTRRGRPVWLLLAGLLLGCALSGPMVAAGPASPAAAHANLLESSPGNGAIVSEEPPEILLTFSEPVRPVPDRVVVVGPDNQRVDRGEPRTEGEIVVIPLGDASEFGTYLVSYRVISQDSHPVAGSFTFSVGAPSEQPPELVDEGDADPVVTAAISVAKTIGYAGLVLVIGPVVMLALLWPQRLSRRGISRLVWIGLGLVGVSTLAGLWLQAPYTTGGGLFDVSGGAVRDVLASGYGTAHVVRLGVLVAVAVLLRPLLAGAVSRSDLVVLGGLGLVGLGTWPFAGHPIASPVPVVSVPVQTVHLAAAAFWVGGLVVLAGFLLRHANERELGAILPVWSVWAAISVSALMLAGLIEGVIEIGPPEALLTTNYGRLLLAKVGLFALVVVVAGYSRRLVRSKLAPRRPSALRIAVIVEAVVLAGALGVASVLVQTTPGRTDVVEEAAAAGDFGVTLESALYTLQVVVEPAEQGTNLVHLYAFNPAGEPQPVEEWQGTAQLPDGEVEPLDIPLLALTDDHATGQVILPTAGEWEFQFTLRTSEIDQATVTATVPIQ